MTRFRDSHRLWRWAAAWLAGIAAVYSASLGVLGAAQAIDDSSVELAFERGHVFVVGLWGLVALGLVLAERRLESAHLRAGGLLLAGATFVQATTFGASELAGDRLGAMLLVAAASLLAVAFADALPVRASDPALWPSVLAIGSMGLAFFGLASSSPTDATRASRGSAWRRYSPCSQPWCSGQSENLRPSWGLAAIVAAIGFATVLSGNWLVLAWCATAAVAVVLSSLVDEERLTYGAAGYLVLALVYTLGDLAAPRDFFSANTEPAAGVPSVALVVARRS